MCCQVICKPWKMSGIHFVDVDINVRAVHLEAAVSAASKTPTDLSTSLFAVKPSCQDAQVMPCVIEELHIKCHFCCE